MLKSTQKSNAIDESNSGSAQPAPTQFGQRHATQFTFQLQQTTASHARLSITEASSGELDARLARFSHDFTRVPMIAKAQDKGVAPWVSAPGDSYEQQADRVADQVLRMPEPRLQRACACGGSCDKCSGKQAGNARLQAMPVQANGAVEVSAPPTVRDTLRSPGQKLDDRTRHFMEPRFGRDLSGVRIHADAQAAESARSVGARAYTVGNAIVFGDGQYSPESNDGRRLLAHELTHVMQQREDTAARSMIQRAITLTDPGGEVPHPVGAVGPFPTKAFTLNSWLDTLCPDGSWDVDNATGVVDSTDRATFCGARPARGHIHHTTSRHPTSCGCLCELTGTGAKTIEVQIDENLTVGGASTPLAPLGEGGTSHVSATDKVTGFTGRPGPSVTGAGATTPLSGTGRAQQIESPPWVVFGHEVCGHARLQAGRMSPTGVEHATTPQGDRTAVDVENRIRREHSTVASSLGIRGGGFQARDAAGTFASHDGAVYRVASGETLSGIAIRCGISVVDMREHIWRFNGDQITAATQNTLAAGEDLLIEGINWHEVITGETMSSIATIWGITLASLKRANPQIAAPAFMIHPGDRLLIPVV
jgi:LysM repeat protein